MTTSRSQKTSTILDGGQTVPTATLNNTILTGTVTANSSTGTSGQYLQTTGTGVQWASVSAGAGNMSLIASGSLSSGTSLSLTGLSSYSWLKFAVVTPQKSGYPNEAWYWTLNSDSGSNYTYIYQGNDWNGSSVDNNNGSGTSTYIPANAPDNVNGYGSKSFVLTLTNTKSTGYTDFSAVSVYPNQSSYAEWNHVWGSYNQNATISSLQLLSSGGGAFVGGTYYLWGA
jgi:hypothetical protein